MNYYSKNLESLHAVSEDNFGETTRPIPSAPLTLELRGAVTDWLRKNKPQPAAPVYHWSAFVHPSNYTRELGVSERTVRRRRKSGITDLDKLFEPIEKPLEFEGKQYSATKFAKAFSISKIAVLAGIRAGKSAQEILDGRQKPGRRWRN